MNNAISVALCGLALTLAVGCEKKPEVTPTPADPAPAAPAAPAAAEKAVPAAVALDLSKVPVEEQYEKEVEAEVTAQNFETQLEALEKEIKAE